MQLAYPRCKTEAGSAHTQTIISPLVLSCLHCLLLPRCVMAFGRTKEEVIFSHIIINHLIVSLRNAYKEKGFT